MHPLIFAGIFACLYGFLTSFLGNKIIDFLFMRKRYDLTFQDDMYIRGKNRKFFLFALGAFSAFVMINTLTPFALPFALVFAFSMIIAARTDIEQHLIFDFLLLPCAVLGLIAIFAMKLPIERHLTAAAALFSVMLLFAVLSKGGVGGGDIKLLAAIGLWLGDDLALLTFVCGAVLGGLYSLFLIATKRAGKGEVFPYGPFYALSAITVLAVYGFQY